MQLWILCASVPDVVANSMSLLLAVRISSFFSVSSSARQQMISPLWRNKHTHTHQHDEQVKATTSTMLLKGIVWQPVLPVCFPVLVLIGCFFFYLLCLPSTNQEMLSHCCYLVIKINLGMILGQYTVCRGINIKITLMKTC